MMSKKKYVKGVSGHPGAQSFTRLEQQFLRWAEGVVRTAPDDDAAMLGASVVSWIGVGNPGRLGLTQCVAACYQLSQTLSAVGISSELVVVHARIKNEQNVVVKSIGSDHPVLLPEANKWSGHCVLYIPEQGRILDPTIGQGFLEDAPDLQNPLIGRVVATLDGTPDDAVLAGTQWRLSRGPYMIQYEVLDDSFSPLHDRNLVAALDGELDRFRAKLPELAVDMRTLVDQRH